jgi:hypothetical protein
VNRAASILFAVIGIVALPTSAQKPPATCVVTISTPEPGDDVGRQGPVRGNAKIPPGTYLWVLAHMKDLTGDWWPQGGRPALFDPKGDWVIITGYGRPEDVNQDFEIRVVVVGANTNTLLRDWFKDAKAKDYPPIESPTPIDGCAPITETVHKTRQ